MSATSRTGETPVNVAMRRSYALEPPPWRMAAPSSRDQRPPARAGGYHGRAAWAESRISMPPISCTSGSRMTP